MRVTTGAGKLYPKWIAATKDLGGGTFLAESPKHGFNENSFDPALWLRKHFAA